MKITRVSDLTGIEHTMDLDVTEAQLQRYLAGTMAQHAFPHLTPAEREFIMTGTTQEEWDKFVPPDED